MALTRGRGSQKLIQTGRMFLLTVSLGLLVLVIMAAPIISPLTHPTTRYGGQIADGSYLIPSKTLSSVDGEEDVWLSKVSQSQAIAPIEIDSDYTLDSDLTFKSHGFLVIADDITLDLNGYTITGSEKGTGIDMNGRMGVTVKGGTIELFEYGIHLFDSSGNTLSGNTVTANENGFTLENSNGNTITGNTATANGDGFSLWGSSGNTITGNTATANDRAGFRLSISSNNNIFSGNTATTNEDGFNLRRNSDNNTFSGNTVTTNENGFALLSSSGNTFSGNTATANGNGFTLGSNCENNTLTGNNVTDNEYGIYLEEASGTTIFNNYFDNDYNAYDFGTNNAWNINKTPGTNIIGGSYLGGNYWMDYGGEDADGDGLGDTPYTILNGTNQDNLPLVKEIPVTGSFPISGEPVSILLATLLLVMSFARREKRKAR